MAVGDAILGLDFGYVNGALPDISDLVWLDANHNGLLDGAEAGLVGVTVNLVDAQSQVIATTITAADGAFAWRDLPDGFYGLRITDNVGVLDGLLPTTMASTKNLHAVTLAGLDVSGASFGWADTGALEGTFGTTIKDPVGEVDSQIDTVVDSDLPDYDFGYRGEGSIGDLVWLDQNRDGLQVGESGIADVVVGLFDDDGLELRTTTTDADGTYRFDHLIPGTYSIRVDRTTLPGCCDSSGR